MNKNLIRRSSTALIFVGIVISSLFIHPYMFAGLFLLVTVLALLEFFILAQKDGFMPQREYGIFVGIVIFSLSFLNAYEIIPAISFIILLPIFMFIMIFELYRKNEHQFRSVAFTLFGVLYVSVPLGLLNYILLYNIDNTGDFSYIYMLSFFMIIWSNDTGAYLVGSSFGRTKLFEKVSPKKTWEGTLGGVAFSVIIAIIISLYFNELSTIQWIIYAVLISVFGTYGDLAESMLKRRAGVKDSGNILPGHGGILDRFDSAFFAAPAIFVFLTVLEFMNKLG